MSVNWYGLDFLRLTESELARNMAKAGGYFASKLRGYLNDSQSYKRTPSGGYVGLDPSVPGGFPKKLSGQLQRSITWELDRQKFVLTVGTNLKGYPKFLQLGTTVMKPRPWLSLGFDKTKDAIARIIVTGK
ncbi:hypothetical protein GobsT_18540 [Gemmata obscuriglobus]|uniref:HK97 gp10 family phage protein n=1 Tax=Gemmata obscuriglobus TaxID=114 RepID=A0A2Z3HDL7_9BACT|nr:hypothetical protein [Gemmata obscuriglobus]AWM39784.1 hypothetical protein C1280_24115 [Gemmata obscuriglobus]QEG27101.1 hypothetical protein GobsT_18540 [Gemmata obscuriglobus]VTS03598.1 Marine sediment metagenome DNA, contig: S03H2_L02108 OS=marine sediment metagenome GN=S03H2_14141 PE=4 SV=1 [Gemmata obscuriglobus UQM 2246]